MVPERLARFCCCWVIRIKRLDFIAYDFSRFVSWFEWCARASSPLGLVALDRAAALHHVLKHALLSDVLTSTRSKMALSCSSILWDGLWAEAWTCVICLVLIKVFLGGFARCSLRKRPARHILLAGGVCWVLRSVAAWTDGCRRASLVLKPTFTTSVAKGIFCCLSELWLTLRIVLRAGILLQIVWLHLFKETT